MISSSPFAPRKKKKRKSIVSFVEALRETNGGGVSQLKSIDSERKSVEASNKAAQEELRRSHHQEVISTNVYDSKQVEVKAQIESIQAELKNIAKDLLEVGTDIQKAIHEETVNPGTYHVSFFEKLRIYLLQLRKKVAESKNWLALSNQRKKQQNHYWGKVKKSGTKFLLSQERYMSTQAG